MVEWETGNISSSHRAINKMTMGMLTGRISGGLLIVPTLNLAAYLTDRIGNLRELRPYFRLWQALPIRSGYLGIITVEHDEASYDVQKIPKGKDGNAILARGPLLK